MEWNRSSTLSSRPKPFLVLAVLFILCSVQVATATEKECNTTQPLKDMRELEGCHYINNDLGIDENTDLKFDLKPTIQEIRGCLVIKGSNYKNLEFLNSIQVINCSDIYGDKHGDLAWLMTAEYKNPNQDVYWKNEIVGNKKMCVTPESLWKLTNATKVVNGSIEVRDNKWCRGVCRPGYVLEQKDVLCSIIKGDLVIENVTEETKLLFVHLKYVEEIQGQLLIVNTSLNFIDLFSRLHTIGARNTEKPALVVRGNMELTGILLPSLKKIVLWKRYHGYGIVFEGNNPDFTMDSEEKSRFEALAKAQLPGVGVPPYYREKHDPVNETTPEEPLLTDEEKVMFYEVFIIIYVFLVVTFFYFVEKRWGMSK